MYNLIYTHKNNNYYFFNGEHHLSDVSVLEYIKNICILNGASLYGHIMASKKLLPQTSKLPIYLASEDEYLIPLSSFQQVDCYWFCASEFLYCFEKNNKTYIKFKDRSACCVPYSTFTINKQYQKYVALYEKREEMKKQYEI